MTIQEALTYGRSQLQQSPTPQLDARLLLQHTLSVNHSYLILHNAEPLTPEQEQQFKRLIAQARQQEPIPYLIGRAPFFDFELAVNTAVLIPRPETEQLVELALAWAQTHAPGVIVDVGTGSGCIAIALARQLPQATVYAVDISEDALQIARRNAARLAPDRIWFHQGNLLAPIPAPVDLVVANLPYVTTAEWTLLDDGVKLHEPSLALRGGTDGLDLVRRLLTQARTCLRTGGAIFLEIGWRQGKAAREAAREIWPSARISLHQDYAGRDRFLQIETRESENNSG